jgi:hypothetical protein
MRMFSRLMALIILLGVVGSDALAQAVPGPVTPPVTTRMRKARRMVAASPYYSVRRQRRHRNHRYVMSPFTPRVTRPF